MNGRRLAFLSVLAALLVSPFLNKPVHIDDTFVLHISRQILQDPFDPLAGDFDWFGHPMPVWRATTNPPFVSYWLAPVIGIFGEREVLLHLAIVPFYLLLIGGTYLLAVRFTSDPWLPVLFVFCSAPVLVSGNLMRDIPAAGLALAGTALSIQGADRGSARAWVGGGILLGLAILTKYSVGVILPVVALYVVLRRRPRLLLWLALPSGLVAIWCAQTWLVYGEIHPLYLLTERSAQAGIPWQDKFFGGLTILGSGLFLQLPVLAGLQGRRHYGTLGAILALSALVTVWGFSFYGDWDWEFQLWLVLGIIVPAAVLISWNRAHLTADHVFLVLWFLSHFLFSVFFVPFQAVRHLIVAIAPLAFLVFRQPGTPEKRQRGRGVLMVGMLAIQLATAMVIHSADYEYADAYRRFAELARERYEGLPVWFVGHWGWKHYAEKSGFRMLHGDGPLPAVGDLLIWPQKVHIGDVFNRASELRAGLELQDSYVYPGRIPVRVMSMDVKAGFYAVIRRRIPFRFNDSSPLENFRVYRVQAPAAAD